tara:strand:+ start:273 stop:578 length:306 start_codon:yes stop_codon:yes gene_type:complete
MKTEKKETNMKIMTVIISLFLGILITGFSYSKTTGPIPENENYMMEQVQVNTPESEWFDYNQRKEGAIIIEGGFVKEPDCSIGREDGISKIHNVFGNEFSD